MPWCLLVVDGPDLKRQFPLPVTGKVRVGKDPDHTQIQFNDFYLEKTHCLLEVADNEIVVRDTSRERGVFVNGKRIVSQATLVAGEVLRVGNTHLRLDPYDGPTPEAVDEDDDEHAAMPALAPRRLDELQGHTLGHYEIGLPLGKGHHGIVFRALDLNTEQSVALKVLSPEFPGNMDELKHFAGTIKAIKPIAQHPHLVHWSGAGKIGHYVWIAQELVEGDNLRSFYSQPESARWSWRSAWRLAWELGGALDHLHRRHVAHGNITEANILLTEGGKHLLNDLRFQEALAGSALQERVAERKQLAELQFCPPERLEEGAFVDENLADIYSLGVATYLRLSNGSPLFQADEPAETIDLILEGVAEGHRRHAPGASDAFLEVLYKMLARKQEDRYQSAADLLADLEPLKLKK